MSNAYHFQQHPFTSTMTKHNPPAINIFIVLLTALIFFSVLSWFNFALAVYGTLTSTDPNHVDTTMNSLGFAIIWTIITISIYYTMEYAEVLSSPSPDSGEPLLREGRVEGRTDIPDFRTNIGSDYIGRTDMAGV